MMVVDAGVGGDDSVVCRGGMPVEFMVVVVCWFGL